MIDMKRLYCHKAKQKHVEVLAVRGWSMILRYFKITREGYRCQLVLKMCITSLILISSMCIYTCGGQHQVHSELS
ncbi:hypothetical protein AUEXF2481DRAFT_415100 [Aureobasidium subglaciale EXF-2481]|uniref:Uncharacterized protein n=1 Tax=Aureobasidium subglaciale (strain EXF-2481) TaxID=1043005 RepID=A0A074Y4J5_AURSE|nr:uncharacterized protein AUEXF2481DRAFT_415100 [Aureobasidium subglaciale EXF-2481]KEQ92703.1 hypothetical protein AUEXF2481DRAFT_415100 [Aureobasidium subglaciale EXF-2481]